MKIESQVCSLKQAKNLKKLGVKQDSVFYWVEYHQSNHGSKLVLKESLPHVNKTDEVDENVFSAYSAAELMLMIGENNCSFNPGTATQQFAYELIGDLAMGITPVDVINNRLISA